MVTEPYRIEIICIGDELLDGRTADENACWLGQRLSAQGLVLRRAVFVHDDEESIRAILDERSQHASYLLVAGGLGPTEDDRTRQAAATWAGVDLVENTGVLEQLELRYRQRGLPFPGTNRRQALIPAGAELLANEVGTAPGFRMRSGQCIVDVVPGVPSEFRWFVDTYTLPLVMERSTGFFDERTWTFFGLTESQLAQRVEDLASPQYSIHYLPHFPSITLFARGRQQEGEKVLAHLDQEVRGRVGSYLVAEGEETLVGRLGQRLRENGWTLATAESCTGGLVGQMITSVAGASDYYLEGFVTYSNRAKMGRLGVQASTLDRHGAVSAECAAEMARGARERTRSDAALSVTGIAGPGGGTTEKPIGTVFLGLATPTALMVRELELRPWNREQIRVLSAWSALSTLLWILEDRLPEGLARRL